VGDRRLSHVERRRHVPREGPLEAPLGYVKEGRWPRAPNVVDQYVKAPEPLHGRSYKRHHGLSIRKVAGHNEGGPSVGLHVPGHRLQVGLGAGRHRHVGAGLGEPPGYAGTDTPTGAGDNRHPAVQAE